MDKQTSRARSRRFGWALLGGAGAVGLTILALGGYALDWRWTGFSGNTVWDWLQLLVLPLTLTLATAVFSSGRRWSTLWSAFLIVVAVALGALAVGGYLLNWAWTGFQGNTVWDWLQLLLLPLIITALTVRLSQSDSSASRDAVALRREE